MMKVLLEEGVWLADTAGNPGRTLVKRYAREFETMTDAVKALESAREYRPFKDAQVVEGCLSCGGEGWFNGVKCRHCNGAGGKVVGDA